MSELLIGCGSNRVRKINVGGRTEWSALTTLDMNADHKPDVVHDLEILPYPFPDNSFDEIHAYDVLEHQGRQGDFRFFFAQWEEFWRILKPNGFFCAICPKALSPWAWGDPGHTRIISSECLGYLDQRSYAAVGTSPITDYRFCYKANFEPLAKYEGLPDVWQFVLRAVK